MPRVKPSRAFLTRDRQRKLLTAHVVVYMAGLIGAAYVNRETFNGTIWVQWVALGWGLVVAAHGVMFARSTLATMGPGGGKK